MNQLDADVVGSLDERVGLVLVHHVRFEQHPIALGAQHFQTFEHVRHAQGDVVDAIAVARIGGELLIVRAAADKQAGVAEVQVVLLGAVKAVRGDAEVTLAPPKFSLNQATVPGMSVTIRCT